MDERRIEQIAPGLGQDAADRVDLERVATGVVARLRAERRFGGTAVVWRWLAVAAALALGAGATVLSFRATSQPGITPPTVAAAPLLDPLSADELVEVLDSLTWESAVHEQHTYGLDDLDTAQLRELLASMEG